MKFNLKSQLRIRAEWLDRPQNRKLILEADTNDLHKLLDERKEGSSANIATRLGSLGAWHAQFGIDQVGKQNLNRGWQELARSIIYRLWDYRITMRLVELDERPNRPTRVNPDKVGLNVLAALWVCADEHAKWLGSRYCAWLADDAYYGSSLYIKNGFAGFACQLFCTWANRSHLARDECCPPLGIYSQIFESWIGDEAGLERAVLAMCDFHVARMSENHDRDIAEFSSTPYDIVPVEYLALQRVRYEMGLKTPKPKHPLLATPFVDPPEKLPDINDELLDRAVEAVHIIIPDL